MAQAAALGPCSGEQRLAPKGLGLAESSALSRPPPWANSISRLGSGGPRLGWLRAKGRCPPIVDTLTQNLILGPLCLYLSVFSSWSWIHDMNISFCVIDALVKLMDLLKGKL